MLAVAVGISAPLAATPQEAASTFAASRWEPFQVLVGSWRGEVVGRLGRGSAVRRYKLEFNDQYLVMRHESVRLPQPQSIQGDHHKEIAIYSVDRERNAVVLREFIIEGHVLQYLCAVESTRFVCTSESIENGAGMRARVTIDIQDRFHFTETFELAEARAELRPYLTVTWTRVPDLTD